MAPPSHRPAKRKTNWVNAITIEIQSPRYIRIAGSCAAGVHYVQRRAAVSTKILCISPQLVLEPVTLAADLRSTSSCVLTKKKTKKKTSMYQPAGAIAEPARCAVHLVSAYNSDGFLR